MVEGGSGREFRRVKGLMFEAPRLMHELLDKLARAVGVSPRPRPRPTPKCWGGVLSTHAYDEFSLRYLAEVVAGVNALPAPLGLQKP